MILKTTELTGAALVWAVGRANKWTDYPSDSNDQTALDIALENMNTCHPDHVPKYAEIIRMIEAHQGLRIDKAGCEVQQECISPQCF